MSTRDRKPRSDKIAPWFTKFMNTCVIYFEDGLMHGVDMEKTVEMCFDDPEGAIATLAILAQMVADDTRKDKGAEMMAGSVFISYHLMRHQQAGLPMEEIDLSKLPPELSELRREHPAIDSAVKHVLEKSEVTSL